MAACTPRDRMLNILYELEKKNLKRFKAKLNQGGLDKGRPGIAKAQLEEADTEDVVDLMINAYTAEVAIEVCHEALLAINQKELAVKLMER